MFFHFLLYQYLLLPNSPSSQLQNSQQNSKIQLTPPFGKPTRPCQNAWFSARCLQANFVVGFVSGVRKCKVRDVPYITYLRVHLSTLTLLLLVSLVCTSNFFRSGEKESISSFFFFFSLILDLKNVLIRSKCPPPHMCIRLPTHTPSF